MSKNLSFYESMDLCRKNNINNRHEYRQFRKEKKYKIPYDPHVYYKEWISWAHFCGTEKLTIDQLIYECKKLGITNRCEYKKICKIRKDFPKSPWKRYKNFSWYQLFGGRSPRSIKYTFKEIKKKLIDLGIRSLTLYKKVRKENCFPCNPKKYYEKEWMGWDDFFGRKQIVYMNKNSHDILVELTCFNHTTLYRTINIGRNHV